MKPDNDILKQVDRRSGMTVPDDYFANFARQMMQQLPEKEFESTDKKILPRTWWQRCRPYVYLAAMFAGIWCMMKVFNDIGSRTADMSIENNPVMASVLSSDHFYDYY
ncbi:hypothetical protein, partial [uncultured Muribaculum sp.]